jgi:hypothetical protein
MVTKMGAGQARRSTAILLYYWSNIWKERNRRIFEPLHRIEFQMTSSSKQDIDFYNLAFRVE